MAVSCVCVDSMKDVLDLIKCSDLVLSDSLEDLLFYTSQSYAVNVALFYSAVSECNFVEVATFHKDVSHSTYRIYLIVSGKYRQMFKGLEKIRVPNLRYNFFAEVEDSSQEALFYEILLDADLVSYDLLIDRRIQDSKILDKNDLCNCTSVESFANLLSKRLKLYAALSDKR